MFSCNIYTVQIASLKTQESLFFHVIQIHSTKYISFCNCLSLLFFFLLYLTHTFSTAPCLIENTVNYD